jgi:hypothetical protein
VGHRDNGKGATDGLIAWKHYVCGIFLYTLGGRTRPSTAGMVVWPEIVKTGPVDLSLAFFISILDESRKPVIFVKAASKFIGKLFLDEFPALAQAVVQSSPEIAMVFENNGFV